MATEDDLLAQYNDQPSTADVLRRMGWDHRLPAPADYKPWGGLKQYAPSQPEWMKTAQGYFGRGLASIPEEAMVAANFVLPTRAPMPMKTVRAYHGTGVEPFSEFAPFSHFGTADVASRMTGIHGQRERVIPVDIEYSNPLRITDVGGHSPLTLALQLDEVLGGRTGAPQGIFRDTYKRMLSNMSDKEVGDAFYNLGIGRGSRLHDLADPRDYLLNHPISHQGTFGVTTAIGERMNDPAWRATMYEPAQQALKRAGYDLLEYPNVIEGKGELSYMAPFPDRVRAAFNRSGMAPLDEFMRAHNLRDEDVRAGTAPHAKVPVRSLVPSEHDSLLDVRNAPGRYVDTMGRPEPGHGARIDSLRDAYDMGRPVPPISVRLTREQRLPSDPPDAPRPSFYEITDGHHRAAALAEGAYRDAPVLLDEYSLLRLYREPELAAQLPELQPLLERAKRKYARGGRS